MYRSPALGPVDVWRRCYAQRALTAAAAVSRRLSSIATGFDHVGCSTCNPSPFLSNATTSSQPFQSYLDEVKSIHSLAWDSLLKPRSSQGDSALVMFSCRWSAKLASVPLRHPVPLQYIPRPCFTHRCLLNLQLRRSHNILIPLDQRCSI